MRRIGFVSLFLLFLFPRASAPRNARDVVADIARTIGAANLNTIQYSGSGYIYFFGQSYEPGGPWPKFNSNSYTYLGNYEKGAAQEDMVRTQFENPERGGGFQPVLGPQRWVFTLLGDSLWHVGSGTEFRPGAGVPSVSGPIEEHQARLAMTPHGWVKAAMASNPVMSSKTIDGKKWTVISFTWGLSKVVNGWWMANIFSIQSGYPFNVNATGLLSNNGVFGDDQGERVNLVTAANLAWAQLVDPQAVVYDKSKVNIGDPNHWFNEHMFTIVTPNPKGVAPPSFTTYVDPVSHQTVTDPCGNPTASGVVTDPSFYGVDIAGNGHTYNSDCWFGYLGNEPRNDMRGPHLRNWDFSMNKDTALPFLGESGKLEFRADFFNLLNNTNFGMPTNNTFQAFSANPTLATLGGSGSNEPPAGPGGIPPQGKINSAGLMRQVQFALKVIF
jgi:hypothetical protein